ncbi:sensor histidine kinase [Treponema sp. OMZ 792]|uniref:sensor histidine kinase n=1 Tax=unclassified Treponema TaxID=2638727 RepID=UPI0020A617B4|nr:MULTISPECIES: sensor histidine kinase [unclassified Treponema]UTC75511.1 sensor histidine kinase [Treponema sp. OMZ 792]UTC79515.1 sensor histidine kinase [Treponema sp. OMZ 798]
MKNKFFIFIHYFLIASSLIQISINGDKLSGVQFLLYLCFIILFNLRLFYINNKTFLFFILCLTDWTLCLLLHITGADIPFLLFLIPLIDSFYYNSKPYTYILGTAGLAVSIFSLRNFDVGTMVNYTALFILSGGVLEYFKNNQNKIISFQNKIDELDIQKEELLNSIHDLEIYNESIEDLMTLKERNRISREIHDSVGHGLSTMIIQLNALYAAAKNNNDELPQKILDLNSFAKKNLEEVRFALRELKPIDYNKYETIILIHNLINEFKKMTNINVQFTFSKDIWSLNEKQSHAVYKAVQEFLSNSAKYGKASKIIIHFSYTETSLIVTMKDNGIGCTEIKKGIGLKAIEERVKETDGTVYYESLPAVKGFFMRLLFFKNRTL